MKEKLILSLFVFSVGLFIVGNYTKEKEIKETAGSTAEGYLVGDRAFDFRLLTDDGNEAALSDFSGKPVFINFWASWCPPCRAEMPHIQQFFEGDVGGDIGLLSVNLTFLEKNKQAVKEFVEKYGLSFPIMYDDLGDADDKYKVNTIPTSLVVDSDGIIRHRIVGPVSKERLIQIFRNID